MLYQELNNAIEKGFLDLGEYRNIPLSISKNLNSKFEIRDYQKEAFARFAYYSQGYRKKVLPIHLLFNMAT